MTVLPAADDCTVRAAISTTPLGRCEVIATAPWLANIRLLAGLWLLLGLAACANTNSCANHVETFGGTLVMEPGGTGLCRAGPCLVQLRMPPGTASYEVLADGVPLGRFPAGETVTLGQFASRKTFVVKGAGVYPATLYVQ